MRFQILGEIAASDRGHAVALAIQTYIGRLRAALGGSGIQIVTGGGYRIEVPAEAVDLHEFRQRLARARELAEPGGRAAALAGALELWRGPLFGGVASDRLSPPRRTPRSRPAASRCR